VREGWETTVCGAGINAERFTSGWQGRGRGLTDRRAFGGRVGWGDGGGGVERAAIRVRSEVASARSPEDKSRGGAAASHQGNLAPGRRITTDPNKVRPPALVYRAAGISISSLQLESRACLTSVPADPPTRLGR
jgi:hypothetical protein